MARRLPEREGDIDLVKDFIPNWLVLHGKEKDADFVYRGCLESKGGEDFLLVKIHALKWLNLHKSEYDAVYLTKAISKMPDIPPQAIQDILFWCRRFPADEDTPWRVSRLINRASKFNELSLEIRFTLDFIMERLLKSTLINEKEKIEKITRFILPLIYSTHNRYGPIKDCVDNLFLSLLKNPASFGTLFPKDTALENWTSFQRVSDLIVYTELSIIEDREAIERFLQWVDTWEEENKKKIKKIMDFLKLYHPSPGLWETVVFKSQESGNALK
jgi:hypothetical protein